MILSTYPNESNVFLKDDSQCMFSFLIGRTQYMTLWEKKEKALINGEFFQYPGCEGALLDFLQQKIFIMNENE